MNVAILGNSGSGKSTLARWLADRMGAALLDLDTVAWEPGRIAVPRSPDSARVDVRTFCRTNERWIVEGCYTGLIEAALHFVPRLVFLDPGEARCVANCRERPWEPHKYATRQEQDERLECLLAWVRDYYVRDDDMSLSSHRRCFSSYEGPKEEFAGRPKLEPPEGRVLALLR
jgi:adenylate kinase family enzyme